MSSEKKLRQFLQDRFDHEEFAFDDAAWKSTRGYLDSRRKRTRAGIALVLLALLTIVSGGFLLSEDRKIIAAADVTQAGSLPSAMQETDQQTQDPKDEKIKAVSSEVKNVERPEENEPHNASPDPKITETLPINKNQKDERLITTTASSAKVPDDLGELKVDPYKNAAAREDGNDKEIAGVPVNAPIQKIENENISNASVSELKEEHAIVTHTSLNDPSILTATAGSAGDTLQNIVAATISVIPAAIDSSSSEKILNDSTSVAFSRQGLFFELGGAWLYGWNNTGRDGRGFSPLAGISYMSRVDSRSSLSFGIQYLMVPNLSAASRTSRVTSFRFGEESRVTVITPVRLHYLLMPFRFYRCFHGRNIFGGGITIGYLLNTEADVTSYDERPDGKYNYETVRQSGYKDGFSWYDSQLTAFYRKDLCRSFGIHAEAFFGLTDIKNDQFFRQSNKERNSGLKLSLIYYPLNTSLK